MEELIEHLAAVAKLMDSAFTVPGTKIKIGLDGLIGIIPGIGDAIGAVVSSYIVLRAYLAGIPRSILTRMGLNIAIDFFIGVVPVIGDILDFAWKSNELNISLLRQYNAAPYATERSSRFALAGILAIVITLVLGMIYFLISFLDLLYSLLKSLSNA